MCNFLHFHCKESKGRTEMGKWRPALPWRLNALNLKTVVNQPISASTPATTEARGSLSSLQQLVINPIKRLAAGTTITL